MLPAKKSVGDGHSNTPLRSHSSTHVVCRLEQWTQHFSRPPSCALCVAEMRKLKSTLCRLPLEPKPQIQWKFSQSDVLIP